MTNVYKAPQDWKPSLKTKSIFLAGSIEMGKTVDWQKEIINHLNGFNIDILNPRRDDWDSSWEQSIHDKNFYEQVSWELYCLENCDHVYMYFSKDTQSPIS